MLLILLTHLASPQNPRLTLALTSDPVESMFDYFHRRDKCETRNQSATACSESWRKNEEKLGNTLTSNLIHCNFTSVSHHESRLFGKHYLVFYPNTKNMAFISQRTLRPSSYIAENTSSWRILVKSCWKWEVLSSVVASLAKSDDFWYSSIHPEKRWRTREDDRFVTVNSSLQHFPIHPSIPLFSLLPSFLGLISPNL